ncbi:MAG: sulfatase-like hydrolase/transferase [Cytophagales bacterium]|uniref:sulfatase-like hydrolase/transferase n=1 Tax=Cyclobacterium marinum TaxID=104 RepID=UPI0030DA004F|nr:sulfatase-like hydrolase/transferase [Cytophagales bacterium]|tara:strand:+ start:25438 stop:26826 length:1389 start_codon:yes stop_codon:yes gene_type:complete
MKLGHFNVIIFLLAIITASCNNKEVRDLKDIETKPNILLLFSDDHQSDLINALGNPYIKTPHLDKLVKEGTTFTQAFTETPTCVPSRASLLTGCSSLTHNSFYPRYSGTGNESLEKWPKTMKDAGYTTFWTGKWNAHGGPERWGIDMQSRVYMGGMGPHMMSFEENGETITGFSSELFADAAIRFLNEEQTKPFFLTVAFTAPHDPRTPPQEYKDMYKPNEVPLPANFYSEYPYEDGYKNIRDEKLLPFPRNVDSVRNEIALYYGMISHMDTQIGRILEALDNSGLADNTIVIYASDNGLAVGHHGLLGKMSFYRHSLNVPLIIKGSGIPKNTKTDAFVYLYDLYPTICEIVGIEVPQTVESSSFLSILKGDSTAVHQYMFGALADLKRSVTTKQFKLIRHYYSKNEMHGTDEYLFYDLKNDPLEIINQIQNPEYSQEISKLKEVLANWQEEKNDFLPNKYD